MIPHRTIFYLRSERSDLRSVRQDLRSERSDLRSERQDLKGGMETGENRPAWNHRSSAPLGPLPKRNDLKGPKLSIRFWRISVTFGSGIAGFNCICIEI